LSLPELLFTSNAHSVFVPFSTIRAKLTIEFAGAFIHTEIVNDERELKEVLLETVAF
jgi:hypothetical protein